jgi:hypothetical protein
VRKSSSFALRAMADKMRKEKVVSFILESKNSPLAIDSSLVLSDSRSMPDLEMPDSVQSPICSMIYGVNQSQFTLDNGPITLIGRHSIMRRRLTPHASRFTLHESHTFALNIIRSKSFTIHKTLDTANYSSPSYSSG